MSKRTIALIAAAVVVVVLVVIFALPSTPLGWSIGPWVIGSGAVIADEHLLEGFDQVEVSNAIEVEITQSEDYSITITGYQNLLERVEVELSEHELTIRLKPGTYFRNNVKAVITMPDLNGLVASGATTVTATGFASASDFDLKVSGASRVDIDIEAGNTTADISGASRVMGELKAEDIILIVSGASRCELTGSAADMDLDVSGASRVTLQELQVQNADVTISGASRGTINVMGILNVEISGASSLQYTGDADLGRVDISGASTISRL